MPRLEWVRAAAEDSNQLRQLFHAVVHQEMRPALQVLHGGRTQVDAEVVVDGREDFLEVDRAVLGDFRQSMGRAIHLAAPHAAAPQYGAGARGPMFHSASLID